ncbi:MAG TPA: hypothetical protein VFN51_01450 [Candidatus Saccharimonadales bacterium]|nr:hypothetical protein [Candidatus Saccharimonadales bacterium]
MKKQKQSGFAAVELVLAVVLIAAIAGVGYYVWHSHKAQPTTTASNTSIPGYQSPPVTTPAAPQISQASDLNNAMQALNQTSVTSSNTDSNQLNTETSGF